jgi:serine/threonine protein kinase/Tol biopolymer transport system component
MTLPQGTKLGPYEVLSPLGSGGMGEVYRARDTRLGRDVAVKVLPAERLSDPARRARFTHEARAASSLNHPNIVTIHEIESAEGIDFIVMELVPGKTLDALIPRQGMRLGEAMRIAIPLADALAAAHAAGIVHRDFKPGNVMVTPDGVVKVLDFGLAKLTQGDEGGGEDRTTLDAQARLSHPGLAVGTPAYMSPEQATGGEVDTRSDVFSFGALLYEMVTGRRPFGGGSSAEILAAILKEQPRPPTEVAPDVPRELERIVLRCLRKEPGRRFQHMTDLKVELQEVKEESDSLASAMIGGTTRRSRGRWLAAGMAGIALLAAAASFRLLGRPASPPPRLVVLTSSRAASGVCFSPDGSQIAFTSRGEGGEENWDIWLRIVGETESRRLTTDPADDQFAAWSPDGRQIAFLRWAPRAPHGAVYVVSPLGGSDRKLSDLPARTGIEQLSWSPDGRWLAVARARLAGEMTSESGGIHLIPAAGGESRPITSPAPPTFDRSPAFSPDGRSLAFASCEGLDVETCELQVVGLDRDLRPRGRPRPLGSRGQGTSGISWTRDGRSIVFGRWDATLGHLWRVDSRGERPPERLELAGAGAYGPAIAASRNRLAFVRDLSDGDIFRLELGKGDVPWLPSSSFDYGPQYSPDGQRVAFGSMRSGDAEEIWLADADGSTPTRLTRGPGRSQGSPRWSPDGRTIAFDSESAEGHWDVWTIGVDGAGLRQVTQHPGNENLPGWSRDGRWIYFGSDRTGRSEIWRVPARGGPEEQVTRDGGSMPFESPDGRTLYSRAVGAASPCWRGPCRAERSERSSTAFLRWATS